MATLNSCRKELHAILRELKILEEGIRTSFSGIGQDRCADCLESVIERYQMLLNNLDQVDPTRLASLINGEE